MICLRKISCIVLLALTICAGKTFASHILAGGLSYTFVDSAGGHYHYKIRLTLYQDCLHGQPEAIAQDNPAFITIYPGGGTVPAFVDTTLYYTSASVLPVDYTTPCGTFTTPVSDFCALKKIFEKDYYLPPSPTGYTVVYQRCCRSASVANVVNPGDEGTTYFCDVPPIHVTNTSAVFAKNPPLVVCKDNTLVYDLYATDADGDSLSYELSQCYQGASSGDIKPTIADHPPLTPVTFVPSSSFASPLGSAPITYNPVSGWLTITPDHLGVYLVGISCKEWRHGTLINTTTLEFNCLVVNCAEGFYAVGHPYAGNDTVIYTGDSLHFNATGGVSFIWSPSTYLNSPVISDPVGIFTTPGIVTYVITSINDSGCTGKDTLTINVIDHPCFAVPNGFTPNGDGRNDVLKLFPIKNAVLKSFRIYNRNGRLMFSTTSPNEGWDGKYDGKEQGLGTYTWEIQYEYNEGVPGVQTGNVTLLR